MHSIDGPHRAAAEPPTTDAVKEFTMKSIAKVAAPLVLVFAAFGAQASELATGDIGAQPVTAGTSMVVAAPGSTSPLSASRGGEVGEGDIGATKVSAGTLPRGATPQAPGHIMTVGA
jgi:hypothetical protein